MSEVRLDFIGDIKDLLPQLKQTIAEAEKLQEASGNTGKKINDDFGKAGSAVDGLKGKISDTLGNINIMGVRAGDVGSKLKAGFDAGTKGAFTFSTALKSIPLLAILAAIVSLLAYFTKTEKGMETLERVTAALGAAFDVVVGRVARVGEALVDIFVNGNISEGIDKIAGSFTGVTAEINEAARAAINFTQMLQEVEDAELLLSVVNAKRKNEVDLLIKQSKDHNLTIQERINKLNEAGAIEGKSLSDRIVQAEKLVRARQIENDLLIKNGQLDDGNITKDLAAAQIALENLRGNSLELQQKFENAKSILILEEESKRLAAQKKIDDERKAAAKKAADERLEIEKDTIARIKKLTEEANADLIKGAAGEERIELIRSQAQAELKVQEDILKKRGALTADVEKKIAIIRNEIEREATESIIKLQEERIKANLDQGLKMLDTDEKIAIERIRLLENPRLNPAILEEEKQKAILRIQIEYAKRRYDALNADTTKEGALQQLQLKNQIKGLEGELDKLNGRKKGIFEQLGFTPEQTRQAQQNLRTFAGAMQSILSDIAQARVDSANEAIEAIEEQADREEELSEKRIERIENDLDTERSILELELENRARGYSNDVDGARERVKELQQAKQAEIAAQQRAQEQEKIALKKAEAERRKALKEQRAVESASQAISIITASANILKGWSTIPYVGQVLGAAAIAAMVGAFIATKVRIAGATRNEGFRKGGYTGDGRPWEEAGPVHKKEFVFNEEKTAKNRDVFEAIHNNKISDIALRDLLKGTGVVMRENVPIKFNRLISESKHYDNKASLQGMEKSVKKIESNTNVLAGKATERTIEFFDGYRIETFGNIKRRING